MMPPSAGNDQSASPGRGAQRVPLLSTKLHMPPPRPTDHVISRPRLFQRLDEGLRPGHKLTLVSAPAGFGKTTLLSQWVHQAGPRVSAGWLSLDQGDNDLGRFWFYIVAALQTVLVDVGDTIPALLRISQPLPMEALVASLVNELASRRPATDLALVLDDYHAIETQTVHQSLTFLIDHLPVGIHLILATRSDPPLPLSRLRGHGQLAELRSADLRFTPDEAASFLNGVMGLELAEGQVANLEARTEGWIAGLQMAALSMQRRNPEDVARFIAAFSGSNRFILDYLVDEVLDSQPETMRSFLVKTAVLDRLSGPLCRAVTGEENAQELLSQMEAANLFVVPLDDERRWYRYHHLFAELLRSRLESMSPEQVSILHTRASEWYAREELVGGAVSHAVAAGDAERVARLVAGKALGMMDYSELATLERSLRALPEETVHSEPWLCIAYGWILAFTGQLDPVAALLNAAEQSVSARGEAFQASEADQAQARRLLGHIAAVRAYVAGVRGNTSEAIELARQALKRVPKADVITRGWAAVALALALYSSGDFASADEALALAAEVGRAAGDSHVGVMILCNAAAVQMQKGQLREAFETFREALALSATFAARAGRPLPVSGYAHTYLAVLLSEWNDLDTALWHVRTGIALCAQWGEPQLLTGGYMCLAHVRLAVGDYDGALAAVQQARQAAQRLSRWYAARVAPLEVMVRLRQGDIMEASRLAAALEEGLDAAFDRFEYWSARLTLARAGVAQGRTEEALGWLRRLEEEARAAGAKHYVIASLALQAVAFKSQRESERALDILEQALGLAEPEGYVRLFVDEGPPMHELLRALAASGNATGYAMRLLGALRDGTRDQPSAEPLPRELVEPLTPRELEVLRLLAAGLTNGEIARELYISTNTVKTHAKNIYARLDVHNRRQAADRAKRLGLL